MGRKRRENRNATREPAGANTQTITRLHATKPLSQTKGFSIYSFALAYELISQFKQISSKTGAVHCMMPPNIVAQSIRERIDSIAHPRTEINTR